MGIERITKRTKIVATVGPASDQEAILKKMMKSGLNVVRCNFSHGDHTEHGQRMKTIRRVAKEVEKNVAILLDISGPKIRIGDFEKGKITLRKGQTFILTTKKCSGNDGIVYVNYRKLPQDIKKGSRILLDDGKRELKVMNIAGARIETKVIVGGMIRSRRGVNLPGANLSISSITPKDGKDIIFGVKQDVDIFALSFVRSADDVKKLRRILRREKSDAMIIAKIETQGAVKNIDAIIAAADGVMVARGDLAVEVGPEEVPHLQKKIARKCNIVGKPVIIATQMLDSMSESPVPTRAEVNDVTNAIIDGADAVMLSGETAVGAYPLEAVQMMRKIAIRTEEGLDYMRIEDNEIHSRRVVNAVSQSVVRTAHDTNATVIVALTESGFTARKISRYKPQQHIIALSPNKRACRQLMLSYGCYPRFFERQYAYRRDTIKALKIFLLKQKVVKEGDQIVIAAGMPFGKAGTTNMMIVEKI